LQTLHSFPTRRSSDLDQAASQTGRTVDLLIQVDLAGEPTKHGLRPDELMPVVDAADQCRSARLAGLMLLPPASPDPEQARPFFRSEEHTSELQSLTTL